MAQQYQYTYAVIDPVDNMCIEVVDTTVETTDDPNFIPIPEYNGNYLWKYYNRENGKWYTDAAFTNEWTPA